MCATRWRTCRRFPCSSCKARPFWRISVVWRRDRAGRIARRCSAWTGSPATTMSGRCWTRPDHFHPVFAEVVAQLERLDGLKDFRQLGDHVLIALDGTEYNVSSKVRCQHCSTRKRGKYKTEHFHALVSATIVAPEHNRVVPLEPEFIVPQDGHEKQDCESRAAGWSAMAGTTPG